MIQLYLVAILLLSKLGSGHGDLDALALQNPVAIAISGSSLYRPTPWGASGVGALGLLGLTPYKRDDSEILVEGWFKSFAECCIHYQAHGTLPSEDDGDNVLGAWLSKQIMVRCCSLSVCVCVCVCVCECGQTR
jgi:hypothetical protein